MEKQVNLSGIWLLPTRGRLPVVQKLLDAAVKTGMQCPGLLIVSIEDFAANEEEYLALTLPVGWNITCTESEGLAAKIQEVYERGDLDDYYWIGLIANDNTPVTPGWESKLASQVTGYNIVSSNDLWQAPSRIHGATIWSRDLIDAVGYFAPTGLHHNFFDDVWETIGRETRSEERRVGKECRSR